VASDFLLPGEAMQVFLLTLGCPKNEVDSEMMVRLLVEAGHSAVADPGEADVLIVNTCAFIHDARQESLQTLLELARSKRPDQWLVAAGCFAQRDPEMLCRRVPQLDAVIGTRSWPEITSLVDALGTPRQSTLRLVREDGNLVASVPRTAIMGASAFIKIADGCDAGCAFCAIPLIKGPQVSKPLPDILREARELAAQGVKEYVLIAQDTTAYGRDLGQQEGLSALLLDLASVVPQDAWIRILYAYPQHISDRLIETMASVPQVCHYLDLPLQHGHPDVLRRMRRPHDVSMIVDRIQGLRAAMPDIALRTTFLVGFPGESESEFDALLAMLEQIAFDHVGVFAFSREQETLAAEMPGQVPAAVGRRRQRQLMRAQQEISLRRNREQLGRELDVLIEDVSDGLARGRSYRDAPEIDGRVTIAAPVPIQGFVRARIIGAGPYDLVAERVE